MIKHERKAIISFIKNREARELVLSSKVQLTKDMFLEKIYGLIYDTCLMLAVKYGLDFKIKKAVLITNMSRRYKIDEEELSIILEKIYDTNYELNSFKSDCDEINFDYRDFRVKSSIQNAVISLDGRNYNETVKALRSGLNSISDERLRIDQAEISKDWERALKHWTEKGQTTSFKTGFELIDEYYGGSFLSELYIILANTSVGKSFMLMEIAYQSYIRGLKVAFFTIEMNKEEAEQRLFSRIAKIKNEDIRKGRVTKEEKNRLQEKIEYFAEKGGLYDITSFSDNCKMSDISARIEYSYFKPDIVVIDYLNDLTPGGKFSHQRDWDAIGEISWDMHLLAKSMNVALWTASQAKPQSIDRKKLSVKDFAYSPLPAQHANAVVYLTETVEDKIQGTLRLGYTEKCRGSHKILKQQILYPNLDISRINCQIMKEQIEKNLKAEK